MIAAVALGVAFLVGALLSRSREGQPSREGAPSREPERGLERRPEPPSIKAEDKPVIPQPPGATGNLVDQTRPLARPGFDPEKAYALAPKVFDALKKTPASAKPIVIEFQRAADLRPIDGVYGPRTAGALEFYIAREGMPPLAVPRPFTKDKRIIPYRI